MKQKTFDRQSAKLIARIAENLPEMPGEVMQKWINNPKALKESLSSVLCPSPGGSTQGNSFIVGEFFRSRSDTRIKQQHWALFKEELSGPSFGKRISLDLGNYPKLKQYKTENYIRDPQLQKKVKSTPMTEEQFWFVLYALVEHELHQQYMSEVILYFPSNSYIFHLRTDAGKLVSVTAWKNGNSEWQFDVNYYCKYFNKEYDRGNIFLYF